MIKNSNNKVTLEVLNDSLGNLAGMVAKGFDDIERRMVTKDEFNSRLGSLEKKVDKLDYQVSEAYDILKRFKENDILNLQKRVQILEKAVRALAGQSTSK